ncbi:MAG: metallophosphoesterase [Dehalococcoidia bacterium]|nr:metallophosphoesterase [Dehalococcoidia bacterium]
MRALPKIFYTALCLLVLISVVACLSGREVEPRFNYESDAALRTLLEAAPDYPETSFIVFSDPHTYDPVLGTEGQAFEDYLTDDRKLLRESTEIMEAAVAAIINEEAGLVFVPGDLTKDGERVSHELVAGYLSQLEAGGKQVYVVPGNHDVKNGHSFRYIGDKTERVPNITPAEFAQIYDEFGYKEALYRDPASLSYVAEPQAGLWLFALDSCLYLGNVEDEEPITDGKFSAATLEWIEEMLEKAARENKAVIVMMHHGIVEHYVGQEKNFGEYVLDDYPAVSKLLAMYNARLVFTGHYHAQDITVARWSETNKFVYDIETGSLVTYPAPYRIVSIDAAQKAAVQTRNVESISSHPDDFQEYARAYVQSGIKGIATRTIMGYKVDQAEAEKLAEEVAQAFLAHYAGDEYLPPGQEVMQTKGLSIPGRVVVIFRKDLVIGLWNDLEPPDNNVTIDLKTGNWR